MCAVTQSYYNMVSCLQNTHNKLTRALTPYKYFFFSYRDSHYGDEMVIFIVGIPIYNIAKMASLYGLQSLLLVQELISSIGPCDTWCDIMLYCTMW